MKYYKLRLTNEYGMTLIELMVAIAITGIIMTLSLKIFFGQYDSYIARQDMNELQSEAPIVVEIIKGEMQEAGWSVTPDAGFYFEDGGDNSSDRIYINDITLIDENNLSTFFSGSSNDCPGGRLLTLKPKDYQTGQSFTFSNLDIDSDGDNDLLGAKFQFVITDNGSQKVAKINSVSGTTINLNDNVSGHCLAPAIYYCLDDGVDPACHPSDSDDDWVLRKSDRTTGGRRILAKNIVDLQVVYRNKAGTWYGSQGCGTNCAPSPFNPTDINTIYIMIVARSEHKDGSDCRPQASLRLTDGSTIAANRSGGSDCGYKYRTYGTRIYPRNTK